MLRYGTEEAQRSNARVKKRRAACSVQCGVRLPRSRHAAHAVRYRRAAWRDCAGVQVAKPVHARAAACAARSKMPCAAPHAIDAIRHCRHYASHADIRCCHYADITPHAAIDYAYATCYAAALIATTRHFHTPFIIFVISPHYAIHAAMFHICYITPPWCRFRLPLPPYAAACFSCFFFMPFRFFHWLLRHYDDAIWYHCRYYADTMSLRQPLPCRHVTMLLSLPAIIFAMLHYLPPCAATPFAIVIDWRAMPPCRAAP